MRNPVFNTGDLISDIGGNFYRIASKTTTDTGFVFRLADLQGNSIPTPANFHPVSAALARTAAWMRFVFAYNKDFDLYVKEYIKEAGLPIDPKMNWAKWFQYTYAPKLSGITKDPDVVDEAVHQVIITALAKRKDLTKFDPKRLPAGAQAQPLAEQVTTYLQWLFKKRVSEAYEFIKEKLQPAEETSMYQPGLDDESEVEKNILDTEEHATPGGQGGVEEQTDLSRLRDQFAAYLQDDETPNEIKKLLVLYDFFTANVGKKLKISDYESYWKEHTGLGFDSLKPAYAKFYGYIPDFMVATGLVSAEKAKARGVGAGRATSSLHSLTLAAALETGPTSDEEIIPQAAEAGPANDELQENSHTENGGSPVLDGELKSPERANVNAVREALDTQAEMEVGMPIAEKVEEIKAEETAPVEVESGKGKQIIINIAANGNCECGHHKTYHDGKNKMCHGGTKENPCNCDGRFKKVKAAGLGSCPECGQAWELHSQEEIESGDCANGASTKQPDGTFVDAETDIAAPTMKFLGDTVQKGDETLYQVEMNVPGVGPMPIWMPLELLTDEAKAAVSQADAEMKGVRTSNDQDAVERTGDKEHDFNPKEAHGCGSKCEQCGEIHGGDHVCPKTSAEYENPGFRTSYCAKCRRETKHAVRDDEKQCTVCHTLGSLPKTSADDTGRMPHNPSAGGARTGPDGPIVVDEKTAAPAPQAPAVQQPTYTRPPKGVGPAVVQYGTPTKTVTEDPEVVNAPNPAETPDSGSGQGDPKLPRKRTIMPELPNAEMIMQLNASGKTKQFEAYGVKGMNSAKWRKFFDSYEQAEAWAEKNDAEIQGFRETEGHTAAFGGWCPECQHRMSQGKCTHCGYMIGPYAEKKSADETEQMRSPEEEENYAEEKDSYDFPKNWKEDENLGPESGLKTWYGDNGLMLSMSLDDARSVSHEGPCDDDVDALMEHPAIADQLANVDPAKLAQALKAFGAWDEQELSDHQANLERMVWIAASDISEESRGQDIDHMHEGSGEMDPELEANERAATPNGMLPEEAEAILNQIQHGDRVTIMVPAGMGRNGQEWSQSTGRAVMRNDYGWALNMGGAHGTPGVATARNIVSVRKAKAGSTVVAAKNPGVWKRLQQHWMGKGTLSFSNKTQEYIVKEGYFYRHGRSVEKLEAAVKQVVPEAQITSARDHWNSWPKNSWFEVRFTVPAPTAPTTSEPKVEETPMATPTASEKRAALRKKIAARRKEREAVKTADRRDEYVQQQRYADPTTSSQAGNAEILGKHGYTLFHTKGDGTQFWKAPNGMTATLYTNGSWAHSGGDTLQGHDPAALNERLVKYHAEMVPKVGTGKYARVKQVAAEEAGAAAEGLEQVGEAFGELADSVLTLRENLDLVPAPQTASLKERIAARRNFAKTFRQIAEKNPGMLEEAIKEVYQSMDEVAVALENYADNMGLDMSGLNVAESNLDEAVIEEPAAEEKIEEAPKEAAAGAEAFSSDRDHDGHPKEAEYQPKTGQPCTCKPGRQRDNCPQCEGTGQKVDFASIRNQGKNASETCEKCGGPWEHQHARASKVAGSTREEWAAWLKEFGGEKLFDSIMNNAEGAQSTCVHCGEPIFLDISEGGGVPDWGTAMEGIDGLDYGCPDSPDTNDEGTGGHEPTRRVRPAPKQGASGSDNFVTDRDEKGEAKMPQRIEVPRLASEVEGIVVAAKAAAAKHKKTQ